MEATPITTAARKIQRTINNWPENDELYFDTEGNLVESRETIPTGAIDLRAPITTEHFLMLPATTTYTQRTIQDHLDARAAGGDWAWNLAQIEMRRAAEAIRA